MKAITLEQLQKGGSCNRDADRFKELFGDSVVPTLEEFDKITQEFDWLTARRVLLTPAQQKVFDIRSKLALRVANGRSDPTKTLRRQALAGAFWEAYNSPEE